MALLLRLVGRVSVNQAARPNARRKLDIAKPIKSPPLVQHARRHMFNQWAACAIANKAKGGQTGVTPLVSAFAGLHPLHGNPFPIRH